MPHRSESGRSAIAAVVVLCACALAAVLGVRWLRAARPEPIGVAAAVPVSPAQRAGVWYWLEKPNGPKARLVRLTGAAGVPLVEADKVTSFDADDKGAAWVAKHGAEWRVEVSSSAGGDARAVWTGQTEPHGVCLAGDAAYWLVPHAAAAPDSGALPPLAPTIELLRAARSGGPPALACSLPNSRSGQVLGVRDGAVYVSLQRPGNPGSTVLYRVPGAGAPPERLASEPGECQALLAGDGTLYWVAPSREATSEGQAVCIRRLAPGGKPETLSDWLPLGGVLYDTAQGMRYVDAEPQTSVWFPGPFLEAPRSSRCPAGFAAIAAGRNNLLLRQTLVRSGPAQLYQVPLP